MTSNSRVLLFTGLLFVVLSALTLRASASEESPRIITLDAPDAGTGPGVFISNPFGGLPFFYPQGTFPYGINDSGAIGGNFQDAHNVLHGFLRTPEGEFITFDAPGAGGGPAQGTQGFAISPKGVVVGKTIDANQGQHGMLGTREGTVIVFDAPGAGSGAFQGTIALSVNAEGAITGNYTDASGAGHAFLRAPDGSIATIDPPAGTGSLTPFASPCFPDCLTDEGAIVGVYGDAAGLVHGFLRSPDGDFTKIDVAGAVGGTAASGINAKGTIVGGYIDANGVNRGFLRARDGTITKFDVPSAGTLAGQGTIILFGSINAEGDVTGDYQDANSVTHGFVRDHRHGAITTFDPPGAAGGTEPITNNAANAITGYYLDASGVAHGFLRTAHRCENCNEE
jgi:hypothetical protein